MATKRRSTLGATAQRGCPPLALEKWPNPDVDCYVVVYKPGSKRPVEVGTVCKRKDGWAHRIYAEPFTGRAPTRKAAACAAWYARRAWGF